MKNELMYSMYSIRCPSWNGATIHVVNELFRQENTRSGSSVILLANAITKSGCRQNTIRPQGQYCQIATAHCRKHDLQVLYLRQFFQQMISSTIRKFENIERDTKNKHLIRLRSYWIQGNAFWCVDIPLLV